MGFSLVTRLTKDNKLVGVLLNCDGVAVAKLSQPAETLEQALERAYKFQETNPKLFEKGKQNDNQDR